MTGEVALFLDRDGVINIDHGYVGTQERWEFMPGIFDLCRAACTRGLQIVVVTNQAGIARGYYSEDDFHALTEWMISQFEAESVSICAVYFCPFHPTEGQGRYRAESADRKPAPGMMLRAARDYSLDLSRSVIIGDHETDIKAGQAAGIGRLIRLSSDGQVPDTIADVVIRQLTDAIIHLPAGDAES